MPHLHLLGTESSKQILNLSWARVYIELSNTEGYV